MRCFAIALVLFAASGAARAEDAPICPDRPSKANGTCTVPAGRWQLETGLADWLDFDDDASSLILGQSTLKLGLTDRSDIEAALTPYVRFKSGDGRLSGIGDLTVRFKQRVTGDGAKVQVALLPFIKLPTAKTGIGNGKVEGGLAAPIAIPLGGPFIATFGPEVDLVADTDGSGRHAQIVQLVNLGVAVAPRLSVAGELWAAWNLDPAGTLRQASADLSAAYTANNDLAFDAGVNIGLTRATPNLELYAGISTRF